MASVAFEVIAALVLVMGLGYLARRWGLVSDSGAESGARLVADVCFPALCLEGLARTSAEALVAAWVLPVLAFVALAVSLVVGLAVAPFVAPPAQRPTVAFCVAVGNWIFLPLPLAGALFGSQGTLTVLLHNVGAQLFLWTAGVAVLRGRGERPLAALLRNAGLWATLGGVALALSGVSLGNAGVAGRVGLQVLTWLGSLTVPLATLLLGAQLRRTAGGDARPRALVGIVVTRLAVAPLVVVPLLGLAAGRLGLGESVRGTEELIALMPVSLTAAAMVQRYAGDVSLAARSIAWSTVLGGVTVPLTLAALRNGP